MAVTVEQEGRRFEYRSDAVDLRAGAVAALNELGREGWQVVAYFPPQAPSESPMAKVLLMREVGSECFP